MTDQERSQFGLQNRWMASLERVQARRERPLISSSSSAPASMDTTNTQVNLTGIQEEPEQEVPVEAEADIVAELEGEETLALYYPSEREMRADESCGSQVKHLDLQTQLPRLFQAKLNQLTQKVEKVMERTTRTWVEVFITKFGNKYHVFRTCQTLTASTLRSSPPCHRCAYTSELGRVRQGEPLWSKGSITFALCLSDGKRKYEICTLCAQELRNRGLNLR